MAKTEKKSKRKKKKDFNWKEKNAELVQFINSGRLEEGEVLAQELVEFVDKKYKKDHVEKATSYNNMGMVFLLTRDFELSEKCFREALSMRKHLFGDEHNEVAVVLLNLMQLYKIQAEEIMMLNKVEEQI